MKQKRRTIPLAIITKNEDDQTFFSCENKLIEEKGKTESIKGKKENTQSNLTFSRPPTAYNPPIIPANIPNKRAKTI